MTTTINQLKKAIKTAEKARDNWNGLGEISVSYDALCDLRSQLTNALIEADIAARQERVKEAEDKLFWDGVWARVEGAR